MNLRDLTMCIAGVALLSSMLDLFTEDESKAFGFRTICGLAMVYSIVEAFRGLINI